MINYGGKAQSECGCHHPKARIQTGTKGEHKDFHQPVFWPP
jgi:hypothetical protein